MELSSRVEGLSLLANEKFSSLNGELEFRQGPFRFRQDPLELIQIIPHPPRGDAFIHQVFHDFEAHKLPKSKDGFLVFHV